MQLAHRVVYCIANGLDLSQIDGQVIRHKCDNTRCVNPEHLEIGTQQDNIRDTRIRGRVAHPRKLTYEQVLEIRTKCVPQKRGVPKNSPHSFAAYARRFGVSVPAIRHVYIRQTYCDVGDPA